MTQSTVFSKLALVALAALALSACATSGDSQTAARDCFTADRIVGWETHDGRTLDVTDTQGDHYRINFCNACSGLETMIAPEFEGGVNGQMCGGPEEVLRIRGRSCRISSVMRVSPQAEELDSTSCF